MLHSVGAGVGSELGAEGWVVDESGDGGVEGLRVFGGDYEAAGSVGGWTVDYLAYLGLRVGGGDYGASAREHGGELGGHDEVGGSGSLGKEMDVGGVEEVVETRERLEGEKGYVGVVCDEGFELGAERSIAAEEEVDAGVVFEGLREGGEEFEALLGSHIAGVEEDDFAFEAEFATDGVAGDAALGVDGVDVDPVGEEDAVGLRYTFGEGALDHLAGDAGDSIEGLGVAVLELEGDEVNGAFGGEEAEIECRVDLEVLLMKPRGRTGGLGCEERDGGAEESGLDGEDDLGLPEELACDDRKAAEHEGREVQDSLEASGAGGNVERGAIDDGLSGVLTRDVFGAVEGIAVVFADAPGWVVRGCGDDTDFVASGS